MADATQKTVTKASGTRSRRPRKNRSLAVEMTRQHRELDADLLKTAWEAGQRIATDPDSAITGTAAKEALEALLDRNEALLIEIDRRLKSPR